MKKFFLFTLPLFLCIVCLGCVPDEIGIKKEENLQVRGTWEGNIYTNQYADLSFSMPDSWFIANDEEIAEMMNLSKEMLTDKSVFSEEKVASLAVIFDMIAGDYMAGENVLIQLEKISHIPGHKYLKEEEYLEITKQDLEKANLGYIFEEKEEILIGDYPYLKMSGEIENSSLEQIYLARKFDDYMFCIVITSSIGNATEILGYFDSI